MSFAPQQNSDDEPQKFRLKKVSLFTAFASLILSEDTWTALDPQSAESFLKADVRLSKSSNYIPVERPTNIWN